MIIPLFVKKVIKRLCTFIDKDSYERLLTFSLVKKYFVGLSSTRNFKKREDLWDSVLENVNPNHKITLLEFGVFEGYSINYFAKRNSNPLSRFIGLDSFEGLPEDWSQNYPKGTFSTKGKVPTVNDERISFIKGWFQDSWGSLQIELTSVEDLGNLIVHYDADLFSSTLFVLTKLDTLKVPYIAIFDEFSNQEARALYNYCQAYLANVEFLGKTNPADYPTQVACRIIPSSN